MTPVLVDGLGDTGRSTDWVKLVDRVRSIDWVTLLDGVRSTDWVTLLDIVRSTDWVTLLDGVESTDWVTLVDGVRSTDWVTLVDGVKSADWVTQVDGVTQTDYITLVDRVTLTELVALVTFICGAANPARWTALGLINFARITDRVFCTSSNFMVVLLISRCKSSQILIYKKKKSIKGCTYICTFKGMSFHCRQVLDKISQASIT